MTGLYGAIGGFSEPFSTRASLDMYTEGSQATGHQRFLQPNGTAGLCPCQRCARHGVPRYQAASCKQPDHPHLDGPRDTQPLWVKDAGGRVSRGSHYNPQRRPVFLGPLSQSSDLARFSPPWELKPAQWSHSPEPGTRHCPSFREQCDCVTTYNHTRANPFHFQIPHPLPHLRVNGQAYGYSRTMFYDAFVDEGEDGSACTPQNGNLDHPFPMVNGHCAPKPGPSKRRDTHYDSGGSNCNGHPHRGFFPTEVPQKHLNREKPKGIFIRSPVVISTEAPVSNQHQSQGSELGKQPRGQDSVRDQIRQVVTDLEDVLGGLKQVHVEMKEVIEQIDHLTANMGLGEEPQSVACGSSSNVHAAAHRGELAVSPPSSRKAAPIEWSRRSDEECIILRTNSPSPVHMASVVKTRCFTPPGHTKDHKHVNGHPPLPDHDYKADNLEFRSQNLNPEIVVGNSTTMHSRTQKPPRYPQNGRCGKDSHASSKAARTAEYAWRGRQNNSMV
ncbi:uncharacterized protein LOC133411961 [Phycodurus eques]|uniref:uncharacterized protein LOC133411961 n=1 Tax=Phycodurus eques TaxID=693459 RepID=UPI002ACDC512|nr:uncharacterized protein LOC133411961 [Phycodurus eques]XP_061550833.1 uncharacterized protein LOC133411961 [Phycodurus eques]XP_061550834.1 uncharacterized protein LOC133411961 [Phycodurus eques]XP_061550835.1 uncharacterized protein LOC133411961 [Phycodurus eques]